MVWHHALCNYEGQTGGKTGHFMKWWDTEVGEHRMPIDDPQEFRRLVLGYATRNGYELVSTDAYYLYFRKPRD